MALSYRHRTRTQGLLLVGIHLKNWIDADCGCCWWSVKATTLVRQSKLPFKWSVWPMLPAKEWKRRGVAVDYGPWCTHIAWQLNTHSAAVTRVSQFITSPRSDLDPNRGSKTGPKSDWVFTADAAEGGVIRWNSPDQTLLTPQQCVWVARATPPPQAYQFIAEDKDEGQRRE